MAWEEALEAHVLENAGQFDAVAAGLADMQAFAVTQFRDTHRRLDRLETDVTELKADVREIKNDVAALKARVGGLETEVTGLKAEVAGIKAEVAGIKADLRSMRAELDALRSDMNTRFDRLEGQIDLLVRVLVHGRN